MKNKKEKGFWLWWAGGGEIRPSRAQGRARARARRPSHGPRRETAQARERRRRFHGPTRQGEREGETAPAADGAGRTGRPRGKNPAAGGLDGDSPPATRFLGIGQAP
jgi:hypothetical protein